MTKKRNISKLYRKMISASNDYKAFLIYERLTEEEKARIEEMCIANDICFFFFQSSLRNKINRNAM